MKFKTITVYFLIMLFSIMPFYSFAKTAVPISYTKRSDFVVELVKLMKWKLENPALGSFSDNKNKTKTYYKYIETAFKHSTINKDSVKFRPNDYLTREELAIMLVRALGYETLSNQLGFLTAPYSDVTNNLAFINIIKDFGLMEPTSPGKFSPTARVKKTEVALILKKTNDKLNTKFDQLNAFYAFSAYNQKALINQLSSVGFCWSQLEFDATTNQIVLNMRKANNNDFSLPNGFSDPVQFAMENHVSTFLNIYASSNTTILDDKTKQEIGLLDYIINNPDNCISLINSIITNLNKTEAFGENVTFDGVVIDFENLRGKDSQKKYNQFLQELKTQLKLNNKKLYVAVQPTRKPSEIYYDGYDFKTIGNISDKVILMAHDYNAKTLTEVDMGSPNPDTPLTPFDEVYYALKSITDKKTGVADLNKILLQISFGSVQWLSQDGKVIKSTAYEPSYQQLMDRFINADKKQNVLRHYSKNLENPWLTYYNSEDSVYNKIWYEDSQSVQAKINLAKMFGIHGLSLWRLGNIPAFDDTYGKSSFLDVWQQIQKNVKLK